MGHISRIITILAATGVLAVAGLAPGLALATSPVEAGSPGDTLNLWRPGDPGQPLRISGWVRSTNGKPIPGATIHIRQADGTGTYTPEYQASLKTGKDGSYRFSTVLPGQYQDTTSKYAIHLEEATVNEKTVLFGRFDMTLRPLGSD
jgi:protocatechuate 3,4-dioxygenase beta subunit